MNNISNVNVPNILHQLFEVSQEERPEERGASEEVMQDLERQNTQTNDGADCPICREGMEESVALYPCNHTFHLQCIRRWLQTHDTCPVCRTQVRPFSQALRELSLTSLRQMAQDRGLDITHVVERAELEQLLQLHTLD